MDVEGIKKIAEMQRQIDCLEFYIDVLLLTAGKKENICYPHIGKDYELARKIDKITNRLWILNDIESATKKQNEENQ